MTAICGVIGEWSRLPHAAAHLDEMLRVLVGSGPGGSALWSDPERGCRLGIAGRCWSPYAPRVLRDGDLIAVCDGRAFACGTEDDEQLLRVWANAGPRGLGAIDAQFAIAVWNQRAQRLTLARDALGVRSLYYHQGRGGLVFASTIEALLAHPAVPLELDLRSVSSFLTVLNVPAPHTLFTEISKLPAGAVALCASDGIERIERFWSQFDEAPPAPGDYAEQTRRLHREAVEARLVDGPFAALVGTADGCRTVGMMTELGVSTLHTFAVALAPGDLAEGRRAADHAGAIHHDRVIDEGQLIEALPHVIDVQDDLVSEPWSVLLHPTLELVRDEQLHVVITGEASMTSLERLAARLGIEARCPYAAPAYAHFVHNTPARFKLHDRDVRPFPDLFRGPFGEWAEPHLLDGGLTALGVLRRDVLTSLLVAHRRRTHDLGTRLWTALVLNLWYERWITRATHERLTALPRGGRDSQRAIARARDVEPPTDDRLA
jgi:asparagine synthetase B (glutamine-hydrolysing)